MADTKTHIVLADVNAALATISAAIPILSAAYTVLKGIWGTHNPSKNESDYIMDLESGAIAGMVDDSTWLTAKGYVQDPVTGHWHLP